MISKKLKFLFQISIPLFIIHGAEEYLSGYTGSIEKIFVPDPRGLFLLFQIAFVVILLLLATPCYCNKKTQLVIMTFVGLIFIFEMIHIVEAFKIGNYYPGLFTAVFFIPIGFLFWKELLTNFKKL